MADEQNRLSQLLGNQQATPAMPAGGLGQNGPAQLAAEGGDDILESMQRNQDAVDIKENEGNQGKSLDEDALARILMTSDSKDGLFEESNPPEEEDGVKLHEEPDEDAKAKIKGDEAKPSKKYEKAFKTDMLEHPDQYTLMTPKGRMTVKEAIAKGYNPLTKRFERKRTAEAAKEEAFKGLNDADREALKQFTDPSQAQVAPADAERYGLSKDSPMVRKGDHQESVATRALGRQAEESRRIADEAAAAQTSPAIPGMAPQGAAPQAGQQPAGADIMSLLGGGNGR